MFDVQAHLQLVCDHLSIKKRVMFFNATEHQSRPIAQESEESAFTSFSPNQVKTLL